MKFKSLTIVFCCALGLAACSGKTGPLYLPHQPPHSLSTASNQTTSSSRQQPPANKA